ncbi:Serine protease [Phytophthora megakarya]|uniref:Serine protease n=1 Tax=Phytophthora megakarya TaxID=4795 RepID=A0A225V6E4_9STRA|nr:Serine protease [Phytophthora megakarya]
MQFYRIFIPVAILAAAAVSSSESKTNEWYPCPTYTFSEEGNATVDAECVIHSAPLCYPGICDAQKAPIENIDIFVKRFPATATDPKTAPNVWMIEGGPGSPSTGMEFFMEELHLKLEGTTNVYTMDHRGSGRSTFLKCTGSSNSSELGGEITLAEVPACAEELGQKYGDLASFSITSAATDLAEFISKYSNGANTVVYGSSYGTIVVERLMHLDIPEITGYVLDSVATSSGGPKQYYLSEFDTNAGGVGDHFLDLCSTDAFCSAHFNTSSLRSVLQELITDFDQNPNSTCAALMSTVKSDEPNVSNEPPSFTLQRLLGSIDFTAVDPKISQY